MEIGTQAAAWVLAGTCKYAVSLSMLVRTLARIAFACKSKEIAK